MSTYTYAHVFTQTHSIVFLSDNMRNTLREVIRENGLSPDKLMQDWDTIERGIQNLARLRASEQCRRRVLQAGRVGSVGAVGFSYQATQVRASMMTCGSIRAICAS